MKWRPVLWGCLIQICLGMFILRTQAGFDAFNWLGNLAQTFINYVKAGVEFVYGESYADHQFAFEVQLIQITYLLFFVYLKIQLFFALLLKNQSNSFKKLDKTCFLELS